MVKKFLLLSYLVILSFSLCGCRWGMDSLEKLKDTAERFLTYIQIDDFESAGKMLHSECKVSGDSLEVYFESVERKYLVNFTNGFTLSDIKDFEIVGYDFEYKGKTYEADFDIIVSCVELEFSIFILENNVSSGIYRFEVDD